MAFGLDGDKLFVILSSLENFLTRCKKFIVDIHCIPHCEAQVFIVIAEGYIKNWKFLIPKI